MSQFDSQIQEALVGVLRKNNMEHSGGIHLANDVLKRYKDRTRDWLAFLFFPDLNKPMRLPELHGLPTHIYKRVGSYTIKTNTSGCVTIAWVPRLTPFYPYLAYNLGDAGIYKQFIQSDVAAETTGPGSQRQGVLQTPVFSMLDASTVPGTASTVAAYQGIGTLPGGFSPKATRLIGAVLETNYVGTMEQMSGSIDVGGLPEHFSTLDGPIADDGTQPGNAAIVQLLIPKFSLTNLLNQYIHKRMHVSDGSRCVWFPLKTTELEFGFPTPNHVGQSFSNVGELADAVQDMGPHLQWNIIYSGMQANQDIRIDYTYYYEGYPDELSFNDYNPKKSAVRINQQNAVEQVGVLSDHLSSTPSKNNKGFWSSAFDTVKSIGGSLYDSIIMPTLAAGGGSMIGSAIGGLSGNPNIGANIGGMIGSSLAGKPMNNSQSTGYNLSGVQNQLGSSRSQANNNSYFGSRF